MKPKIGVVVCGLAGDRQFVTNTYIQSIRYSGGLPFILPLIRSDSAIQEYISFCDGFLFCGGNDITPLLFGEEPKNGIGKTNITLDLFQIRLMKAVLPTKKPVFSICRGMQVYNVACGGTIYQDLSLQPGRPLNHMQQSYSRSEVSHKIHVEKNSQLYQYVGSRLDVNSFHHQSVGMLGKNLTACAHAADKTIEAIEMPGHPFAIGVQWHPECMYRTSPEMRELFSEFVLHARLRPPVGADKDLPGKDAFIKTDSIKDSTAKNDSSASDPGEENSIKMNTDKSGSTKKEISTSTKIFNYE